MFVRRQDRGVQYPGAEGRADRDHRRAATGLRRGGGESVSCAHRHTVGHTSWFRIRTFIQAWLSYIRRCWLLLAELPVDESRAAGRRQYSSSGRLLPRPRAAQLPPKGRSLARSLAVTSARTRARVMYMYM